MTANVNRLGPALTALLLSAPCAALTGCGSDGPELGYVEGTVTRNGEPLPDAEVLFEPVQGSPSYGWTDDDGHYVLEYTPERTGALLGEHTVRISTFNVVRNGEERKTIPETVPPKFNEDSTLVRTVESGSQTFDFDVGDAGDAPAEAEAEETEE